MDHIKNYCDNYIETVFKLGVDLKFWNKFLKGSVENFQKENVEARDIFSSLFGVFDIDINSNSGLLKIYENSKTISSSDLEEYRVDFFSWVINSGIVQVYIAVEVLLIQTIWERDFETMLNPITSKKNMNLIRKKIKEKLIENSKKYDTKNNNHLIDYLLLCSPDYNVFLNSPIRLDLVTTWKEFYRLFSILRNIFSHVGNKIQNDTINEIRTNAKDIFDRHFSIIKNSQGDKQLIADQGKFVDFLGHINEFALNTVKIARQEPNFNFLKMIQPY